MAWTQPGLLTSGFIVSGSNSQAGSVGMLDVRRGAVSEEVEAEAAPEVVQRIDDAVGVEARQRVGLAGQELRLLVDLLPGRGRRPLACMTLRCPGRRERPGRRSSPSDRRGCGCRHRSRCGTSGRPRCRWAPSGSRRSRPCRSARPPSRASGSSRPPAGRVALERGAHLHDVEVHRAGGDRLLRNGL